MKQINSLKKIFAAACLAYSGIASAQIHPLAFGITTVGGTATTKTNWYKDYVGLRFEVVSPASVAGDKQYTAANDGSGSSTAWGGLVTSPLVNVPIVMPQAGDSLAGTAITVDMTGKIALIYRGLYNFSDKANRAQAAGAIACVIVNNVPGGPLGMSAATTGTTIPVFMISQDDGNALDALYNAGDTAHLTITNWGLGNDNDLGFITGGQSLWHAYAIPANQMATSGNPVAYNMVDGAFIANFGLKDAYHVKVNSSLYFTPTGGSASLMHTNLVTVDTFTVLDSVYAMFGSPEYALDKNVTGRYDITYYVSSDSVDQYSGDDTVTNSFYLTDNIYSKGRYDFTNNQPLRTLYEAFGSAAEFVWGPLYYVKNGGASLSSIQFSMASNTPGPLSISSNNIYLFKWTDGSNSEPADSVMQDGELELEGMGIKNYSSTDTSDGLLTCSDFYDADGNPVTLRLESNSWYYLAVDVPGGFFLGCDGILDPYPRIFGRYHASNGLLDYSSVVTSTMTDNTTTPDDPNTPCPAVAVNFVNAVDSFNYANMKGLIPAVALIVNNTPAPTSVSNVTKALGTVSLFPNPATDYVNITTNLNQVSKTVTYTVIDGLGRFVSKEVHNNVLNETFTLSTANYSAGNYFLIVNANGRPMSKKFVVIK